MINSGEGYVRSPLIHADPDCYDLNEIGEEIEKELKSLVSGNYEPEVTDPNLANYSFEDSVENPNPDWWRPRAAAVLEQNDATVENWFEQVVDSLEENEDYQLVRKPYQEDPLTGEKPQLHVKIGDYEQINSNVRVETPEQQKTFSSISEARHFLEENIRKREYNGEMPSYTTERNGFNIEVDPDLSTGFFQTTVEVGPDQHSSEVWMPYSDRERALLIGLPSQFSTETESSVIQVPGQSFTGDPVTDAVAESLSYFLPFEGVQQPEISPEAVDYRNKNNLEKDPYRIQIDSSTWNKFKELDTEYQERVKDKADQIALNPGKTPLEIRDTGRIDQVGSQDIFIKWREHDQSQTIELKDIMTRDEAYVDNGSNNIRT